MCWEERQKRKWDNGATGATWGVGVADTGFNAARGALGSGRGILPPPRRLPRGGYAGDMMGNIYNELLIETVCLVVAISSDSNGIAVYLGTDPF